MHGILVPMQGFQQRMRRCAHFGPHAPMHGILAVHVFIFYVGAFVS